MYLAQGMPFGFVTGTLVTFLATKGYGVKEIAGITFMAQLPWTFKFIWGPIRFPFFSHGAAAVMDPLCSINDDHNASFNFAPA